MDWINKPLLFFIFLVLWGACERKEPTNDAESLLACCEVASVEGMVGNGFIYIPNIFTPDLDGNNERFLPWTGPNITEIVSLEVFDEEETLVFAQKNMIPNLYDEGWDGTVDGTVKKGLYHYTTTIKAMSGEEETFSGTVCSFPCPPGNTLPSAVPFFENCYFPNQHNGEGRLDPNIPSNEAWNCLDN